MILDLRNISNGYIPLLVVLTIVRSSSLQKYLLWGILLINATGPFSKKEISRAELFKK